MPAKTLDDAFALTGVLATTLEGNGFLTAQLGNPVTQEVTTPSARMMFPPGFAARPSKPVAGQSSCQAFAVTGGATDTVVGFYDSRMSEIYGNLHEGEVSLFAGGDDGSGQAKFLLKADGSCVMSTTDDNTHGGSNISLTVSPTEFAIRSKFGSIIMDETGIFFMHASGSSICLGGVTLPAPTNYIQLNASQIYVDGAQVMIGPSATNGGTGVYMAPALAPIASVQTGVPTMIGAGLGVTLGVTSTSVFLGA